MSEEKVSGLIGEIYDASLDPSLWPGVLRKSAQFVRGWSAALLSKDTASRSGAIYYDDGVPDPHYKKLYFEKYVQFDPFNVAHVLAEIGEPIASSDLLPYPEFRVSRIFKEWVEPQGLVDFASVVLERSSTSAALFGVFRHERDGLVDSEMLRRMRLVSPHVRRAVLISRVIELKTTQADTFAELLDGLTASMFLVDAGGRVVHANAAGHAMLADGGVLSAARTRLAATDPQADEMLRDVFAAAGLGDAELGTSGISIPLAARGGGHVVAHALPLTSGARRDTGNAYKAAAVLFVHQASLDTPSPPEVIAKTYKLTPMELRVMLAVVEVGSVPGTAEAIGISDNTVKTHLKRLYAKTGASRQADLVKLIAKFTSPLVGGA